ncbi:DUF2225 domain-containing protein [Haliea sp. E1-2-M8]|uniref:DUF2225 domain-containing protein n=1 Tax=Haliea sp. E1-2-M8 TaxID=3064706 RepID=UPI00271F724F|nr:DUF2225 domain-containing protein [Haliea sp. E1-2-M8]MDO8860305.1 DUF2225 domain-containing protein [Haliea sp. E1-2-M8]
MPIVLGQVTAAGRPISGLLVEAFHVDRGFTSALPLGRRDALSDHQLLRLGSTRSLASGEFSIEYALTGPPSRFPISWNSRRANLWLAVSSCCDDAGTMEFIYQAGDIRFCAGETEEFIVCLPADFADANNPATPPPVQPGPEAILADQTARMARRAARRNIAAERLALSDQRRDEFRKTVALELEARMSLVERDNKGVARDPLFVEQGASVRQASEFAIADRLATDLSVDLPLADRMTLKGRISLTSQQLLALEARAGATRRGGDDVGDAGDNDDTITVREEDLRVVLAGEDGSGANPEADGQIVNRIDALNRFCRDRRREICFDDEPWNEGDNDGQNEDGNHIDDDNGGPLPIEDRRPADTAGRTGRNVTVDELKDVLPTYIAAVLDERSILDPGQSPLPAPGSRLDEEGIAAADSFPSLTLPPGPADVPAFFDFYDLQIAFSPVWQEALDDALIADAEAIYERFVEGGGSSTRFLDSLILRNGISLWSQVSTPVDVEVQRHAEIDQREWDALSASQQSELSDIADEIETRFEFLFQRKLQGNVFDDGLTSGDLDTFNRTKEYVMTRVDELRDQAARIVAAARKELERQAAGKSILPNSDILNQLRGRLNSAYPAKYFAANRRQRSVNFGLMLTYRQRWTPTAYQVGELIKSIPLAPKEVRKYSKKTVRKRRRARKEIETNLEAMKSETNSTTRAEAEIVQDAMDKTNFNASANGSFTVGVWSGGTSSTLSQDASNKSAETKKRMHEAVMKAAREYRNETKVELETEESFEDTYEESGEISNPNDELTVTYLFYELQRRYRVEERLHRMSSVVLVAQEMPRPSEIDEDWLITHRWILNRVLLDDALRPPLDYVAENSVADQFALEEARKSLEQQRRLVEELREDITESRGLTESRYAALQRSMERSARAAQRKTRSGELFGFARKLTSVGIVGNLVDRFIGGEGEPPEAARVREAAAQDAYQREMNKLRDLEAQLAQMNVSLARATEDFADRLGAHLAMTVRVYELRNHIKSFITHYMQAIWMHEPFQQRWLRLKDVPVPVLHRSQATSRSYRIRRSALSGALANVAHLRTSIHDFEVWPEIEPPTVAQPVGDQVVETVPLYQVADIDDLIGFRANYMIFPMQKANAITDFMMEPYVERAAGGFGITDPDDLGNMNLDDFLDYVCCLKENLDPKEFAALEDGLRAQLKRLLQSPLRDDEEIVVPMDAMYIEALPGSRPILEDFKLLHRQLDAADAQEDLRLKRMEKIRYAQRLLAGRTDDPAADARYEFTGNPDLDFAIGDPQGGGGP